MSGLTVAVYAPTPTGGHPEYVAALVGAMADECPAATFLWPIRPDADRRIPPGGRIHQPIALPVMAEPGSLPPPARLLRRLRVTARHDVAFLRWLATHRRTVDVVLLEEYEQLTLPLLVWGARALGLPVAVQVHNVTPHGYRDSIGQRLALRAARYGIAGAHVIAVHTRGNADAVRRLLRPRADVAVIGHGLRPRRSDNPVAPGPPCYLFFGAYRANKGLDVLVDAMKTVPEARLVVAGPVPPADVEHVSAVLAPLGERVVWDRRLVPDEELLDVFAGITAVVLPYQRFEAQSGVLHLAVEMGVPVVVSDAGGLAEVTRDLGIGEVVPDPTPATLGAALRRVGEPDRNADLRARVAVAQRTVSWEASARRFWAALRESGLVRS